MPSNLVPSLPGIRRACGTCVRVCRSGLAARRTDGRTDVVAVVLHSVCVLKAAVRPLQPCPACPAARARCLGWWRGTGTEHLTPGTPRLPGPAPCVGSGCSTGPCPTPGLLLLEFFSPFKC